MIDKNDDKDDKKNPYPLKYQQAGSHLDLRGSSFERAGALEILGLGMGIMICSSSSSEASSSQCP